MIVELYKSVDGSIVYVNTEHISSVRITYGTPGGTNEITVIMDNGHEFTMTDHVYPDGELGPDGLRVMSKIAPEEFTEKFLRVQTARAYEGLSKAND